MNSDNSTNSHDKPIAQGYRKRNHGAQRRARRNRSAILRRQQGEALANNPLNWPPPNTRVPYPNYLEIIPHLDRKRLIKDSYFVYDGYGFIGGKFIWNNLFIVQLNSINLD